MKASVVSVLAVAASVMAQNSTISTVYTTNVYTVTSCAPEVTDCPGRLGQVTTDIISLYTTICPVTATESHSATSTSAGVLSTPVVTPKVSTIYQTMEYTITSCAPEITNCPVGSRTSSVLTSTVICPGPACVASTSAPVCPGSPNCPATSIATSAGVVQSSAPVCPGPMCVASSVPVGSKSTSAGVVTTSAPVTPATSTAPASGTASSVCAGPLCPVVITTQITTCVPTVIYSTVTLTATSVAMCNGVPCVSSTGVPTGASSAMCNGVPCVSATGVPSSAPVCSGSSCPASTAVPCVGSACGVASTVVGCSGAGCVAATSVASLCNGSACPASTSAAVCPGGANCPATTVATKPYSTGSATGVFPGGPKNSTVAFTGAASSNKAAGFLMVAGLFAALL